MKVYKVKKRENYGFDHEVEYFTPQAAEAAIAKMLATAKERDVERAAWLAAHPQPWSNKDKDYAWIHGFDSKLTFEEQFNALGYYVAEQVATPTVYRLNTLPAESPELVAEIEGKVAEFGACTIDWTCTGHTRAQWQSEAACEQLKKLHPEWQVKNEGWHVSIKLPNKEAVA